MTIVQIPSAAHGRLWQVDLDAAPAPQAVAALSDAEWARAGRFVFRHDRRRFIAAHAALRETLSAHTGVPAALLEFVEGEFGKPVLAEPAGVWFNLSHSQSVALIALSDETEVGIDVELLRPMPDAEALAHAYFTQAERCALAAMPPAERDRAFLSCWTRKEACLKAIGMGLRIDTRSFDAGLAPDAREVEIALADGVARIALCSFDAVPGAVCAVARVLSQARAETLAAQAPRVSYA